MKIARLIFIWKGLAAISLLVPNLLIVSGQTANFETRCGWYDNPTPGNHWLSC